MKNLTAVEWLEIKLGTSVKLTSPEWEMFYDLINQAKQMDKQNIIKAYQQGFFDNDFISAFYNSEEYYNDTYKKV